jgi:hypothetical protein
VSALCQRPDRQGLEQSSFGGWYCQGRRRLVFCLDLAWSIAVDSAGGRSEWAEWERRARQSDLCNHSGGKNDLSPKGGQWQGQGRPTMGLAETPTAPSSSGVAVLGGFAVIYSF